MNTIKFFDPKTGAQHNVKVSQSKMNVDRGQQVTPRQAYTRAKRVAGLTVVSSK